MAANSRTAGQEVGQLGAVELRSGGAVAGLELGERGAAAAGLAVAPPGEVEAAAAAGVEHLDVVLRRARRAWWRRRCRGSRSAVRGRGPAAARRPRARTVGSSASSAPRRGTAGTPRRPAARRSVARRDRVIDRIPARVVWRGGNSPSGRPLPSQLSRLTRAPGRPGSAIWSLVCRARSAWKVSTDTGIGRPDASPNGPLPTMPGPPSTSSAAADLLELVAASGRALVGGGDDVALLVLRDAQQPVHLDELAAGVPDRGGDRLVAGPVEGDVAHVGAHRGQRAQHPADRLRGRPR